MEGAMRLTLAVLAGVWVTFLGLTLPAADVQAGGWATVTLDKPIGEPRAGEMLTVSFVVKQHGVTPIHEAFGQRVEPFLIAHSATKGGETLRVPATRAAKVGAFVVEVTFPAAGIWSVEIVPQPFAGTRVGEVSVLTPGGRRLERSVAAASAAEEATIGRAAPAPATAATATAASSSRDTALAIGLVALIVLGSGAFLLARRGGAVWTVGR
jgi:hypothetical protein